MTDHSEPCLREWLGNRTTVSTKNLSLDEKSMVIFHDLVYLENFILITGGSTALTPK